jgi:integrase
MATADRSGKGWRARWKAPDGSIPAFPSKSGFRTKREAIAYGEDQEAAIRAALYIDPKLLETTVEEWWNRWFPIQDHFRPNTVETYRQNYNKHIKPRWGGVRMCSVLPITIQEYRSELRKTYAENTVSVIMTVLRDLFDDAALNRIIHFSPFPKTPRRGTRRNAAASTDAKPKREGIVITLTTVDAICARLKPAEALLVQIAFWTGMRWSEVAAIRLRFLHVKPGDGIVEGGGYYVIDPFVGAVHEDVHSRRFFGPPKSGASGRLAPEYPAGRLVDIPPFLAEMIRPYLTTRDEPALAPNVTDEQRQAWDEHRDLLLPNRKGAPRQYDNWNTLWRRACDGRAASSGTQVTEAIIAGLRLHDCKHSHAALMDDLGIHPVMRDYRLGHTTPGTRGVYSHPTPQMRLDLIKGLQRTWDEHNKRRRDTTA